MKKMSFCLLLGLGLISISLSRVNHGERIEKKLQDQTVRYEYVDMGEEYYTTIQHVENQELSKDKKIKILNKYLENNQFANSHMIDGYLDGEVDKKIFYNHFIEQYEIIETYKDSLKQEDYESSETIYYIQYGELCKMLANKEHYNLSDFNIRDIEILLEENFETAKTVNNK